MWTFAYVNQHLSHMAIFVFAKALNLPNAVVKTLDDVVEHVSKKFIIGYKYFFVCEPKGKYYDPETRESYPYAISCRSFPTKGGKVTESIIGYSYRPIPIKKKRFCQLG